MERFHLVEVEEKPEIYPASSKWAGSLQMAKAKLSSAEKELLEENESGEFEPDLGTDRRKYITKAEEEV